MRIGVPKEIKNNEHRVGMTPYDVQSYRSEGFDVEVENNAGLAIGYSNADYMSAGAKVVNSETAWSADMVVKVKEPLPEEYKYFSQGKILFTYLHLASNMELTHALVKSGMIAYSYETISKNGTLPCLAPMSQIAGRVCIQKAAQALEQPHGNGLLLGGVPGVSPTRVAVIGGGVVGTEAAKIASGMGAEVTILDVNSKRLADLDDMFGRNITTLHSNRRNLEKVLKESDVVVGSVLIPGAKAPHVVSKSDLILMKKGALVVDVAIDQGGCFETSRPTTHSDPTYVVDGIVHYCVANIPGVVARTATDALTVTTTPYGIEIAKNEQTNGLAITPAFRDRVFDENVKPLYENYISKLEENKDSD